MPFGSILGSIAGAAASSIFGGGGGGGTQTVQNTVPREFSGLASQVAQMGHGFANLPYQPYPYATVADFNPYQFAGFDQIAGRAMQPGGLPQQAEQALSATLAGGYQAPQNWNPYADAQTAVGANPYVGAQTQVGSNPYAGAMTQVGANPYAGANPYLEQAIGNAQGDVVRQFNQQVAPSQAATALRSGSFGNSGLQAAENESRRQLAGELGRIGSGMRMGDYGMQQQLAEADINRRTQTGLADIGRNVGIAESDIGRQVSTSLADTMRNAGLYESDIGRQVSTSLADTMRNAGLYESAFGREQDAWNAERNRQMGAIGLAPGTYQAGFAPGQALLGIGGTMQQQGQNVLSGWQDQFNQSRQWPFQIYDTMMAPFGRNIGGTSTTSGPGMNPVAGMIGGGMLGARLGNSDFGRSIGNWVGGLFGGMPQFTGVGASPY